MPTNPQRILTNAKRRAGLSLQSIDAFIPDDSPIGQAGGARALLRATGGDLEGAALLAALSRKETEFGRTAGRFRNNAFGWGVHLGSDVNTSPDWITGARKVWQGLSGSLYRGSGITSARDIIMKYAPPSENDTSLYQNQVDTWLSQMGLNPTTNVFDGQNVPVPTGQEQGLPQTPGASGGLDPAVEAFVMSRNRGSRFRGAAMAKILSEGDGAANAAREAVGQPSFKQEDAVAGVGGAGAASAAEQWLGTPYSWGGGGPGGPSLGTGRGAGTKGFDCSSLVQYAWAKMGVQIPRTTYDQIRTGVAVRSLAEAKPGDLLFPHSGHVMMYIGKGMAIHAPRTGDVVREVPANSRTYIAIRRPVKNG